MPIIVYKMNASPPARAVLVTAEILGLNIETREVSIPNKEHFKPEYLKKNPLHTVPLLEDGDFILADSHAIIIYLVTKYGVKTAADLYPNDLQKRAIIHQRLFLDASILFPRLIAIIKAVAYENAPSIDDNKKADVEEAYSFLEKYLEGSSYLAGENLTVADISCVTTVSSLDALVPISDKYPKLQEWLKKLSSQQWYVSKNQPGLNDFSGFMNFCLQKNSTSQVFPKFDVMPIIVYKTDMSPPARAVLLTAEILGLEIETREVNTLAQEQFTPEFLEKNPLHTVPVLEDKNFVLADSHAIIMYLVSKYGAEKRAQLYPNDLRDRAIVHQRLFLDASILFPRLSDIVKDILFKKALSIDEKKAAAVEEAYGFLEKYLEDTAYLAGDDITIADLACVTTVSSLNIIAPIDEKYPKLQAWINNLSSKEWYQKLNQPGVMEFGVFISSRLLKNAEDIVGFKYVCD